MPRRPMIQVRVVNIRRETCDILVARPSKYGNPYQIGNHGDREQVVNRFAAFLPHQLILDLLDDVLALKQLEVSLGCYCSPLLCHAHVLVDRLAEYSPRIIPRI